MRVEKTEESIVREAQAQGGADDGKKVYPTEQAERKGLQRKDEEKYTALQLGKHFEALWRTRDEEDDGIQEASAEDERAAKNGGAFERIRFSKGAQQQSSGRLYSFEKLGAARSFQEKQRRNMAKQAAKNFKINQNLDNFLAHQKNYLPRELFNRVRRKPFTEAKFRELAAIAKTKASQDAAMACPHIMLSHRSPQRYIPASDDLTHGPVKNKLKLTAVQASNIESILLRLVFRVEAVLTNS